jgi:hypothetical protein
MWVRLSTPPSPNASGEVVVKFMWGVHALVPVVQPGGAIVGYTHWRLTLGQGATIVSACEADPYPNRPSSSQLYAAPFSAHSASSTNMLGTSDAILRGGLVLVRPSTQPPPGRLRDQAEAGGTGFWPVSISHADSCISSAFISSKTWLGGIRTLETIRVWIWV